MNSPAALRVAVVGPTHPHKGGVAAHTTALAHELAEGGHDVTLVSWSHLYPSRLYPGEQAVPGGSADVPPFPRTVRALSWARPDTWVRTGRRLRSFDAILLVHAIPAVVPAHVALLRAAGAGRRVSGASAARSGPRTVVVAHNVLPHETHLGDRELMQYFFERVDGVLVHSDSQARLAYGLKAARVSITDLPPHLPGGEPVERQQHDGPARLLSLGIVRDYKGIDLLMEALAQVPGPTLTVAGEMWGSAGERVRQLARDPRLRDRVEVHGGYVPADRLAPLLASHDVLALTYRSATASQNALLAQRHGLAVLATDTGTFGRQVRDGVDGLLVPPGDGEALVKALRRLTEPGYAAQLRSAVRSPDLSGPWANYLGSIEALASPEPAAEPEPDTGPHGQDGREGQDGQDPLPEAPLARLATRTTRRLTRTARGVLAASQPEVSLRPTDFPDWIRASDVLADATDADEARSFARRLGLPRANDGIAAWAALGALAAIVRVRDDGRRSAVIVDESGARSPLTRWARAIGFEPVGLDLTGHRSSVEVLDVDTASLDVIVRLHPGGCDADDVDEAISQASWALRSGGLLCLTLPLGSSAADGALGPADVRGVLARSHDLGFVLVGDLDGDITERMRRASGASTRDDTAYGLLRLTLRRR